MTFTIIETKTVPTIQVLSNSRRMILHSKYNPLKEVNIWCDKEADEIKEDEEIIVIGLGAGYHIQQLANRYPTHKITVIEFNDPFFKWFKQSPFNASLSQNDAISMKQFSALSPTEKNQIFSSISLTNLLIHKSGLDLLPTEFEGVKIALEDIILQKNSLRKQLGNLHSNFEKNNALNDKSICDLKNLYSGKPIILVSAGPSLDKQLPLLKKIHDEKHFVIGAVGTAVKPLIKAKITPDFFMIIDPNEATFGQLTNVSLPETPLYYLSTAYHDTVMLHTGPKRIVYQRGYEAAETQANATNSPLIQTGGSVATTLLDLMVYLGGENIALIGQDLAYTDGKSHANAAYAQINIQGAQKTINYFRTGKVETNRNLSLYRKWFERYAKQHHGLQLYNCTEGGAYIEHWQHISLKDFYNNYNDPK
ncbi:motility associated factor glycosyltransferase family protein [Sporosarcina ureilytica]|uniref:6-hydroxymethylpterin diphosphokinase MptE-like domain-containing protein n=1 Tax=Sporosarcina ureilytica TaxID=298596 RepID=A0A1D8JIG6_9BACL|nr:6-hydroxymethylpterin diphosphokinase MptE-like protein [Sporosarcina ureilytica]AOV08510.1 hypothetical protein BI350_13860 [Sporosarcina ureilytica]